MIVFQNDRNKNHTFRNEIKVLTKMYLNKNRSMMFLRASSRKLDKTIKIISKSTVKCSKI